MKKLFITLLLSLFIVAGCSSSSTKDENTQTKEETGFTMKNIKGETVSLSDFKGKKVYIKFWASWCPSCLAGLNEFDTLAQEDNDFEVLSIVAINQRGEMNEADFKEWFAGLDTNHFEVLFDENAEFTDEMGVRAYPSSGFFNSEGELVKLSIGHVDNNTIHSVMSEIE